MNCHQAVFSALIGALLVQFTTPVLAQDSFGATPAASMPAPSAPAAPASVPGAPTMPGYGTSPANQAPMQASAELQDYGVPAQDALRPTDRLHAPTPTSMPGARTIDTQALMSLLRDPARRPLVFHVLGSPEHLPGAIQATPAGQGGSFDDATQREFGQFLRNMSRGDAAAPMVFYCGGTHCWMSYNAALRAVHLGYRNVA
ncbi:MAG TPA: hypothetical protein VJ696_09770, partial [Rhodanobacteraceae bacterium]|nr:hypothetical protein [Rhodanobacteraceae bacterium]